MDHGKVHQYFTASIASSSGFIIGIMLGWSNSAQDDVMSGHFGDVISESQYSWIASLLMLGAAISCVPTKYIVDWIGRRITMLLLAIPITIGWMMLVLSSGVVVKCLGRLLQGMSVGAFCMVTPLYINEITQPETRPVFPLLFHLLTNCGIFLVYIIGACLDVIHLSWMCSIFAVLFVVAFMTVPESPVYLIKIDKEPKAVKVLRKLRNPDVEIEAEIRDIKTTMDQRREDPALISTALQRPATLKALFLVITLILFQQMSGIYAVLFYSSHMFDAAKLEMKSKTATVVIGLVLVVGSIVSVCLINKYGRRNLLIISGIFMAISTFLTAFHFYRAERDSNAVASSDWLPITCLSVFAGMFAFAGGPIPWLIVDEIFTADVKDVAVSIVTTFNWLFGFIVTKTYAYMSTYIGLGTTFIIYTIFTVLCVIGVIFLVIETRGKSIDEIQAKLTKPTPPPT